MKTVKRLLSAMLAVMMIVSLSAISFAADDITITVNNTLENRVYTAYQVFSGSLASGILSDIEWGDGVDGDALLAALKSDSRFVSGSNNVFANATNADMVAYIVEKWSYNSAMLQAFAEVAKDKIIKVEGHTSGAQSEGKYVIEVDEVGYYLICDDTPKANVTGTQAYSDLLLNVTGALDIKPKTSAPTFSHTLNYKVDGTYYEAMDFQVGDTVYFKMETTLPSLFRDYKQYHVHMQVELPAGLDFQKVETVYIQHASNFTTPLSEITGSAGHYEVDKISTDNVIINFGNIRAENYIANNTEFNLNDTIVVKYSATVTGNAVMVAGDNDVANGGNVVNASLGFSNDINQVEPGDLTEISSGSIVDDPANVYTYQVEFKKINSVTLAPLKDAEFYLYRNVSKVDGLGNTVNEKQYAHTDENGLISEWSADTPEKKLVSGSDGIFYIKGVDNLVYHLEEIKAPTGYNTIDGSVQVTLSSGFTGDKLTSLSCEVDGRTTNATGDDLNVGMVRGDIHNVPGSTLPSTGGIGTTIFYIVGGMLLLASSAIFILKKRNEA